MKAEIRILGIDDAPFNKFNKGEHVLVVGTVFRGGQSMDAVLTTYITADGEDSTRNVIKMINSSRNKGQLSAVMIDGIAFGGLNVIDIHEVSKQTKLPVMTVIRRMPDMKSIKKALKNVDSADRKLKLIEKAGEVYEHTLSNISFKDSEGKIYFQLAGLSKEKAEEILELTTYHGLMPEPIRVAHIIGAGLKNGESKGRA